MEDTFQIKIFKEICDSDKQKGKNIMISPLSIYHILSLTTNGAVGDTKTEMLKALYNQDEDKMNEINKLIYSKIKDFKTAEISNAIFTEFEPLETFIQKSKEYKADLDLLKSAEQINNWCRNSTHGLIKKIIEKIDREAVMLLINAIYFKGKWKEEFDKKITKKREFINYEKNKYLVKFMYKEGHFNYYKNDELQAISLNYKDDNMKALIILPKNEYNINNYIKKFNQEEYIKIINGLSKNILK